MNKPELLAPAGNLEKLKTAIHYGADAVYLGKSEFSLRAMTKGFENDEQLDEAITFAHANNVKVYVTINIFPHNVDLPNIKKHLSLLNELKPDAIILSDPGVFVLTKQLAKDIPIHISTQANVTNLEAVRFWETLGAKRVNLARELSLDEIKQLRQNTQIELEVFVHGGICISYSGRCYISAFLTGRSANKGECTHSCRWNYALMEETREGQFFPVFENERGSYLMNSKDLCLVEHLPELISAGIDSMKIEGRMKGINYVAGVVHTYRKAIDAFCSGKSFDKETYKKELMAFSSRGYTTGMLLGQQDSDGYNLLGRQDMMTHDVIGVIKEVKDGMAYVELKKRLKRGMELYFLSPDIEHQPFLIDEIRTPDGVDVLFANAGSVVVIKAPLQARAFDVIRAKRDEA